MRRRVVVTGGAGFIGSNIVRTLAHDDTNEVLVIDDLSTGRYPNIQDLVETNNIEFIKGTISDLTLLQEIFHNVDVVFHEAALASVTKSVEAPLNANDINSTGTLNVLVAARDNHVKKVVYASSSSIYGEPQHVPVTEDMTPCPLSPYGVSKLAGEYYCQVFTTVYALPTCCLRYFNVYGPRQDPNSEYAAVIPKFITQMLTDTASVIYGDGTQTRDFTYITDVVHANIRAAETPVTGVFNIASGTHISINDLAKVVMNQCGSHSDIVYDAPRPGDIKHSRADIIKARETLGFNPQFTITQGVRDTIQWFQGHQ